MTTWLYEFDGILGTASCFEGQIMVSWNGNSYCLASLSIDHKQTVLAARK